MRETDLYLPIKKLYEEMGFQVKAEVNNADITAVKDKDVVIIEMKTSFTIKLMYQATQRQRITDKVYVAIPKPNYKTYRSKGFKEKMYLLKRLHIGLVLVGEEAKIEFHPKSFDMTISQRTAKKKRAKHLKEFSDRMGAINTGGTTKTKIMTAYKEQCLLIADALKTPKSIKELKNELGFEKTSSILQKNYNNWFVRVSRGVYQVTDEGTSALNKYDGYINKIKSTT